MAKPTMSSGDEAEHDSFVESQRLPLLHLYPLLVQTLQVFIVFRYLTVKLKATVGVIKPLKSLLFPY